MPPQYTKLKDLHLTTHLVCDGKPAINIVAPTSGIYKAQAARLQAAIEKLTGCKVPIISDDSRHGQWSAISLYCLGRYFQHDYPKLVWTRGCAATHSHREARKP